MTFVFNEYCFNLVQYSDSTLSLTIQHFFPSMSQPLKITPALVTGSHRKGCQPPAGGQFNILFRSQNRAKCNEVCIRSKKLKKDEITSNDVTAGNGRVLKAFMFIVWLYLFEKLSLPHNKISCRTKQKTFHNFSKPNVVRSFNVFVLSSFGQTDHLTQS